MSEVDPSVFAGFEDLEQRVIEVAAARKQGGDKAAIAAACEIPWERARAFGVGSTPKR